ncbi:MAG: peptidase C1 [Planctomycetia bacterium]|nr:peptidase C1 [Planctomycetia bacterium]
MSAVRARHDLRGRFGRARDQQGRETCLAFALSDAHAEVRGTPWSPLCCEYLFYHAKQRDLLPAHVGTTIPAIRAALEHDGQPVEAAWPYLRALPADRKRWKPPAKVGTLFCRPSQNHGAAFQEIWDAVEGDKPVVVGMSFSAAFLLPDGEGVVDSGETVVPDLRHAVVVVGTGTRASRKFVLVRNSWGDTWGLAGYAWLSERYLAARLLVALTVH